MFVDNYLTGEIVGKEREIPVEPSERLDDTDGMQLGHMYSAECTSCVQESYKTL